MPELPEVQTVVDHLVKEGILGRRILKIKVSWPRSIALPSLGEFCSLMTGRIVMKLSRRGKYIVFALDQDLFLLIHLRMTGRLQWAHSKTKQSGHVHVILYMDDGRRLMFHDTRKFGRFYLTREPQTILGKLGVEPLDGKFTARWLAQGLGRRQRQIKPLLLDQTFLAGLGNIYVDEALWASSIHPLRKASTLNATEVRSLHRAIRRILRQAIENAGTSLGKGKGNFIAPGRTHGKNGPRLNVFRQTGGACPRCGHTIHRIVVAQRSSHVCEQCQRAN